MATRFGNSGEGGRTPGQPSNLDETNPGQPLQGERGAGAKNYGLELTEAELMEQEWYYYTQDYINCKHN